MGRHPELRQAFEAYQDAVTQTKFGPLLQQLHLTADQIRQFEQLYRRGFAYEESETKLGPITLTEQAQIPDAEFGEKLQALLGTDGYQSYLAYQSSLTARMMTMGLGSMMAETDSPLTSTQAQQLVAIFLSAGTSRPQPAFWDSVTTQAGTVLSPAQLEQLASFRDLTLARLQAFEP